MRGRDRKESPLFSLLYDNGDERTTGAIVRELECCRGVKRSFGKKKMSLSPLPLSLISLCPRSLSSISYLRGGLSLTRQEWDYDCEPVPS
jgi:hypothetical protein